MRSIPRKHHKALEKQLFGQDPSKNSAVVRGLQMGPTMGLEIIMSFQGRTLSKAYNLTREMIVRRNKISLLLLLLWSLL